MYAVPVGVAVVCLALAACMWFIGGHCHRAVVLLVLVASMGMAGALGQGLHTAVSSTVAATNKASAAVTGGGVTVALLLVCAYVVAFKLKPGRRSAGTAVAVPGGGPGRRAAGRGGGIGLGTITAAAALPWLAAATPGTAGSVMVSLLGMVASLFTGAGRLLGIAG
jgi:hypothetical protein